MSKPELNPERPNIVLFFTLLFFGIPLAGDPRLLATLKIVVTFQPKINIVSLFTRERQIILNLYLRPYRMMHRLFALVANFRHSGTPAHRRC